MKSTLPARAGTEFPTSTTIFSLFSALIFLAVPAPAQTPPAPGPIWDSTGNGLLKGAWYFRQVYYQAANGAGDLDKGIVLYGNLTFDGSGHYSTTGATLVTRSSSGAISTILSASGTYSIAANGHGFLSGLYCPLTAGCPDNKLYVLVSQGLIAGSSTENHLNDVFIAGQTSPSQTASPFQGTPFQGTWTLAGYLPAIGIPAGYSADVFFQVKPDGNGNLGDVAVAGYFGVNGATQSLETEAAVTYSTANGTATINFPSDPYFYSGSETLFFSADGTFCFGGSPSSPDLIVGVRNPPDGTSQTLQGMYFGAGIDENEYFLAKGAADFDTYLGAFNAAGGKIVEADRLQDPLTGNTISNTASSIYPTAIGGDYSIASQTRYAVNAAGTVRIGAGIGPFLGINFAFQAPVFSGPGVYLNPMGVSNAASFAPFTGGISPGEIIVLYGSGFTSGTTPAATLPLPTELSGVQVKINGTLAPLYYVSPGQIALLVPSGLADAIAQIQVINNGVPSNTVTQFVHKTMPGLFTNPPDGVSLGAFEHADGSLVTEASPAKPGETIQAFMTGLGAVSPPVPDGAAAPASPLSYATSQFLAFIGWAKATISFAGLTPTLAGLYQVNVIVPDVVPTGDQVFELDGPDSNSTQGIIPVLSDTIQQKPPV